MIIITNGANATIYYSESQWLDASDCEFCEGSWGFRVPNSTPNSEILGQPAQVEYDPETGKEIIIQPATPPMSQDAVEAIATETLFEPAVEGGSKE
jgi:hypothetical protein